MNHRMLYSAALVLLTATAGCCAQTCPVAPYFSPRSQSQDDVRLLVGQAQHLNLHGMKGKFYGSFSAVPAYTHSFNASDVSESLFGNALYGKRTLKIKGSGLERNSEKDLLAEWFYLSNNFDGQLCFTPHIQNFLADLNLYLSLDKIGHGMYWHVHAPIVWTKWDLDTREIVINNGNVAGSTGFGPSEQLVRRFIDYSCYGKTTPSNSGNNGAVYPLRAAKICTCSQRKTTVADIQSDLGWNFITSPNYHIGLYLRGVIPTGTRPDGEHLFEPIIGNGKHWELGGGLSAHAIMWRNQPTAQELGFYFDASITSLLQTRQKRVFDLKNYGPLSRYMLLFSSVPGTESYNMTPAANLTLAEVKVKNAVQTDIVAMINYTRDTLSWDFGYNFWGRSCEKINCCKIKSCTTCSSSSGCSGLDGTTWGPYRENSTAYALGTDAATKKFSTDDLDLNAARTRGISHKLFTHISYNWWNLDGHLVPFLGIGMEAEFGKNDSCCNNDCSNTCSSDCDDCSSYCKDQALSQWGVWLKGGLSF